MHKTAVLLACMVCASHGKRVHTPSQRLTAANNTLRPLAAVAMLLRASTPTDAFNPAAAGANSLKGNSLVGAAWNRPVRHAPAIRMDEVNASSDVEMTGATGEATASADVETEGATEDLLKTISELKFEIADKDRLIEEKDKIIESMKDTDSSEETVIPDIPEMVKDAGMGITGRWKEAAGNFVMYPKDIEYNPPRGVIHFLGGAFVGAAPHYTYRYLLDSLCDEGYIVVTTPYRLKFDYLNICDDILSKFDSVHAELTAKFGTLPVVGVGHSCGALLHTYIASLFPNVSRDGNVLISWNNKPVTEAIPAFDEVVAPLSKQIMGVDTDGDPAASAREALVSLRSAFDDVLDGVSTFEGAPSIVKNEVVPVVKQGLFLADQIPDLFASIAEGTREFTPTPDDTRTTARRMYKAKRTLLIQFESDEIDETPDIEMALHEAAKQSEAGLEVESKVFGGTHVTPLTQNVILEPPPLELNGQMVPDPLTGVRQEVRENFLRTINDVKTEITDWLSRAKTPAGVA